MMMVIFKAEGQEREIDILLGNILESVSDENADLEEITAVFLKLLDNPLDLNLASKEDLYNLFILNDFQVESLLDYRKVFGRFYSVYELQYVDGFDKSILDLLKPFITAGITLSEEPLNLNNLLSNSRHEFIIRSKRVLNNQQGYSSITKEEFEKKPESRYLSGPLYSMLQYRVSSSDKFSLNITAENDPGEPFVFKSGKFGPDYFSFSLEFKGRGVIDKIIVGDFSAGFGQGLVFWSSFNPVSFQTDPLKIKMTDHNFKSYKSTGEVNFLRGAAITMKSGKFLFNGAFSYRKLDAKITDNKYTVIYETGEHNTIGRISTKNQLDEGIILGNVSYCGNNFKTGITLSGFGFDKSNGKSYSEYNAFQKYDGIFGNAGIDFVYVTSKVRYFGEAALDIRLNPAAMGGIIGYFRNISYGCLIRYYSLGYNAPHSSPYSQNTRPNNEKGIKLSLLHKNIFKWRLYSSFDYTYYSGPRYRVSSPSYEIDSKFELVNDVKEKGAQSFTFKFNRRFYDLKDINGNVFLQGHNKISVKGSIRYSVWDRIVFSNRAEVNLYKADNELTTIGYMVYNDIKYSTKNSKFSISVRNQYFKAKEWDNRIYVSESDLASLYSSVCYGDGLKSYILLSCKIFKSSSIRFKYSLLIYFDRDKIGEGLSLIDSPSKHELKIQLNHKF